MFIDLDWIASDASPAALDAKEALYQAFHSLYMSLDRDYSDLMDLIDEGCASDLDKREYDSVYYQITILQQLFRVLGYEGMKGGASDD